MKLIAPIKYAISAALILIILSSCEDDITPNLPEADPVLAVDAWLTDKNEPQLIRLTNTRPYFEDAQTSPVLDATVHVSDGLGQRYEFEGDDNGNYIWAPLEDETLGEPGAEFTLEIISGGITYRSETVMMNPVPPVDSVSYRLDSFDEFTDSEFIAQFWARDLPGEGDTYWIRSWFNGLPLNLPSEINIAYDAGFVGSSFDGLTFIPPIRDAINPQDDTELAEGDSMYVEIHSITADAYQFLTEVSTQTNRGGGFGELFATPLSNVPTNIVNVSDPGQEVVGYFNVAAVSGNGRKLVVSEVSEGD